jgi:transformation/transcription domain-associated protein
LRYPQVREQAKAFLQKPEDHMQGLNLINSTNLDYFQPQHQAEMINLKAQFFSILGDSDAGVLCNNWTCLTACCHDCGWHVWQNCAASLNVLFGMVLL